MKPSADDMRVFEQVEDAGAGREALSACPSVVILGRPNVGKSTLFNRLVGMRRAIVGDEPGITRDRIHGRVRWRGREFELVDTGGLLPDEAAIIPASIVRQAEAAIARAHLLLFVVDVREGVTPLDEDLARRLRRFGKPIFLIVNKVDAARWEAHAEDFRRLGFARVFLISAEHGHGIGELLDAILELIPAPEAVETRPDEIRLAIIGKPNVGKSSLVNRLLGTERVIVAPTPGTTRDAVDSELEFEGTRFRLIDTAGIRRRSRVLEQTERIAVLMAERHIERADVAVLLIDATEGPTALDARIAGFAHEAGKSLIIAVNKWDLVPQDPQMAARMEGGHPPALAVPRLRADHLHLGAHGSARHARFGAGRAGARGAPSAHPDGRIEPLLPAVRRRGAGDHAPSGSARAVPHAGGRGPTDLRPLPQLATREAGGRL